MKKSVCFVDDDNDEILRFRKYMGQRYIVGAGVTLDDALLELENLRVRTPDLFLIDLYYGPETSAEMREKIAASDDKLSALEAEVRALLHQAGQSPNEGFNLANEAQRRYPSVPRAFFSRKAFGLSGRRMATWEQEASITMIHRHLVSLKKAHLGLNGPDFHGHLRTSADK